MCWNLYLGSACELPTVPWIESHPAFYVMRETDTEVIARLGPNLNHPHIYYAGSHSGCGCDLGDCPADRTALQSYLHGLTCDVDLFVCWAGDEAKERLGETDYSEHVFAPEAQGLPERMLIHRKMKKTAEPGATDNPDDARRI